MYNQSVVKHKLFPIILSTVVVFSVGYYFGFSRTNESNTLPFTPVENDGLPGDGCVTAGCSEQLCVEEGSDGIVTTCEFRDEYVCYKGATCEKQSNGRCGWTATPELKSCLDKYDHPLRGPIKY